MDALQVVDRLDSLWFFSNVLSPTADQHLDHASTAHDRVVVVPLGTIEENKRNDSPLAPNLGRRCSNCGVFAPELLQYQVVQQQPVGMEALVVERTEPGENRESSRRRRRRRSKRCIAESRKILGELDLGSDEHSSLLRWETRKGYQTFGSRRYVNTEMPSLDDRMAMKKHLKSWAQAVACTVVSR